MTIRRGPVTVLDRLSWYLREGDRWLLSGQNGSGKSTLLRLLLGTLWPDAGAGRRLYHFSDPLPSESPIGARDAIRMVSSEQQDGYLRRGNLVTVLDVVRSGWHDTIYPQDDLSSVAEAHARQLVDQFDLSSFAGRPFTTLSSGQARRTLLARAFLRQPRVLLLDELMNGLDRPTRLTVTQLVDQAPRDSAIVYTAHRPSDIPTTLEQRLHLAAGRIADPPADEPAAIPTAVTPGQSGELLVALDAVNVHREGTLILRDLNWQWRTGEHWLVQGENGSGKSTFLRLIHGDLVQELGGRVTRLGITELPSMWELRGLIGYVAAELQAGYDHDVTALDAIISGLYGSIGIYQDIPEEDRARGLEFAHQLGLNAILDRPVRHLSYGQMRQVLIARALIHGPRLLLLDEPFNGLDRGWQVRLCETLAHAAAEGVHLLAVTHHDEEAIPLFNRHARFSEGRLIC